MSRSNLKHNLPELSLLTHNFNLADVEQEKRKFAGLFICILGFVKMLIDCADVLRTVTKPASKVRDLWREFIQSGKAFQRVWIDAAYDVGNRYTTQFKDTLENHQDQLPDLGFLDSNGSGDVGRTWERLLQHFEDNNLLLRQSLRDLAKGLGPHMTHLVSQTDRRITPRSFPEIVLDTILKYRNEHRPNYGRGELLRKP